MIHTFQRKFCSRSRIFRFWSIVSGICGFAVSALLMADEQNPQDPAFYCQASENYLAQTEEARNAALPELDFSCLTNIPSVSSQLASYQLIDVRTQADQAFPLANSWNIPISQLKTKSFLKSHQLMLIGDGFSRVTAAAHCAVLKKFGFGNVKILVGGIDAWQTYKRDRHLPVSTALKAVSAQQVLHEYFNNKVVLIAATQSVAEQLEELGLEYHLVATNYMAEKVADIVLNNTGDGFYPAVIVLDEAQVAPQFKSPLPNLYELAGGIESLLEQVQKNKLTNHARSAVPKRFICGNS